MLAKLAKSNELMTWTAICSPRGLQVHIQIHIQIHIHIHIHIFTQSNHILYRVASSNHWSPTYTWPVPDSFRVENTGPCRQNPLFCMSANQIRFFFWGVETSVSLNPKIGYPEIKAVTINLISRSKFIYPISGCYPVLGIESSNQRCLLPRLTTVVSKFDPGSFMSIPIMNTETQQLQTPFPSRKNSLPQKGILQAGHTRCTALRT